MKHIIKIVWLIKFLMSKFKNLYSEKSAIEHIHCSFL